MDMTNFYNQYKSIERKNKRPNFFFWIESLVFEMGFEFGPKKKKKEKKEIERERSNAICCVFESRQVDKI